MRVAIIGFGEAGRAFAAGWHEERADLTLTAHDRAQDGSNAEAFRQAADARGVALLGHDEAVAQADVVVSLVTADQALAVARRAAPLMGAAHTFLDCNSVAPATKRKAADAITGSGAAYVDCGVLGPVHPRRHRVPVGLAGPDPSVAQGLFPEVTHRFDTVGEAAALKLMRSIVIKGIEGVVMEALAACDGAGMRETVLASLGPSFPGIDWPERAAYIEERVTSHGARRAAEMVEASRMLRDCGIEPMVSEGVARRLGQG